jgi:hypothetical protein
MAHCDEWTLDRGKGTAPAHFFQTIVTERSADDVPGAGSRPLRNPGTIRGNRTYDPLTISSLGFGPAVVFPQHRLVASYKLKTTLPVIQKKHFAGDLLRLKDIENQ